LFPRATVCIAEEEVKDYSPVVSAAGADLLVHPDSVAGIGPIRQWVLDNVEEEVVVMADDDIYQVRCPIGSISKSHVINDPDSIHQILENTAMLARGLPTPVFGFDKSGGDTRKFRVMTRLALIRGQAESLVSLAGTSGSILRCSFEPTLIFVSKQC
jgi:hypothetical protein